MFSTLEFIAINGPSYGFPNITVFDWRTFDFANKTLNHFGQPDRFEFGSINVKWNL